MCVQLVKVLGMVWGACVNLGSHAIASITMVDCAHPNLDTNQTRQELTNLLVVAAMVLMEHDAFLDALTKMYGQTREKGSVNVSMKQARDEKDGVERCLVRAHSGNNNKKGKISTKVHTFAIARSNAAPQ